MIDSPTSSVQSSQNRPVVLDREKFKREVGSYNITELLANTKTVSPCLFNGRKTAVISGAGIAGLAAAFVLNRRGFNVTIVENRTEFSRTNTINLNMEVEPFLRKFGLIDDFKNDVAARIQCHKTIVFGNEFTQFLPVSDVKEPEFKKPLNLNKGTFDHLFRKPGVYSVQIKDLQAFLAKKVTEVGVRILSDAEIIILTSQEGDRVSKIEIIQKDESHSTLEPDLIFIAEGAHPESIKKFEMDQSREEEINACSGEKWIFGNLEYNGIETFVISMVITKTKKIANVIFNGMTKTANVAVTTSDENPNQNDIDALILSIAKRAFDYAGINEPPIKVLNSVARPVRINNFKATVCSKGNVFRIGDSLGHSSPLAGLGGTIGLSLVPFTISKLIDDYNRGPNNFQVDCEELHDNFEIYSQTYAQRWIDKSAFIKNHILGIFKDNPYPATELTSTTEEIDFHHKIESKNPAISEVDRNEN